MYGNKRLEELTSNGPLPVLDTATEDEEDKEEEGNVVDLSLDDDSVALPSRGGPPTATTADIKDTRTAPTVDIEDTRAAANLTTTREDTDEEEEHHGSDHSEVSDDGATVHSFKSHSRSRVIAPDYAQLMCLTQELIKKIGHCSDSRITLASVLMQMHERADTGKFLNLDSHEIFPSPAVTQEISSRRSPICKASANGWWSHEQSWETTIGKAKRWPGEARIKRRQHVEKDGCSGKSPTGHQNKRIPQSQNQDYSLNSLPLATPCTKRCSLCKKRGHQMQSCPAMLRHGTFRGPAIKEFFASLGMHNFIFQSCDETDAPTTFFRNKNGKVLDRIWGTANISAIKCGYLEPCDFPGDHLAVWMDISYNCALGHNPPLPANLDANRLQLHQPPHSEEVSEDVQGRSDQTCPSCLAI